MFISERDMKKLLNTFRNLNNRLGNKLHTLIFLVSLVLPVVAFAEVNVIKGEYILSSKEAPKKASSLSKNSSLNNGSYVLKVAKHGASSLSSKSEVAQVNNATVKADCNFLAKKYGFNDYSCEPNYAFSVSAKSNDPYANLQYAQDVMKVSNAWNYAGASQEIIVAVIDTGVQVDHQDLVANLRINTAEIDSNGLDDDNNGIIDDYIGADFSKGYGNAVDENGHGTHVAGIIGASTNNGIGISGIAKNIKILPIKFIGSSGVGSASAAISAIDYAVANGAKIINASWGAIGANSDSLKAAIERAKDAGVLFVAAAGNDGVDTDGKNFYPAGYELSNIISVGASDSEDNLAEFSNFGANTVDLLAPGVEIASTYTSSGYVYLSGTSMAAPQVAGVATLVLSSHPELDFNQLRQSILKGADQVVAANGVTATSGRLSAFGALVQSEVILGLATGNIGEISFDVKTSGSKKTKKVTSRYAVSIGGTGMYEGSDYMLSVSFGNHTCDLASSNFSAELEELTGRIPSGLKGTMTFKIQSGTDVFVEEAVKISSVKSSKRAKINSFKALSARQASKLCNSMKVK
jgi:subtilisin family serine protease